MSKHSECVMSSPRSQAAVSSGACAIPRGGVEGPLLYRPPSSLPLVDNATGPTVVGHICRLCGANIVGLRHCHMFAKLMTIETRARAMLKISGPADSPPHRRVYPHLCLLYDPQHRMHLSYKGCAQHL